jgi:hypothetical protein
MDHLRGHLLEAVEPAYEGHPAVVARELDEHGWFVAVGTSLDHAYVLRFETDDLHRDLRGGHWSAVASRWLFVVGIDMEHLGL